MRSAHLSFTLFLAITVAVGTYVSAAPEPVLRTVEEAVARLERDVLDTMRQRDELAAYLMRPSGRQQDSIHLPPTIITSWEGDRVQVDVPSYVFLLDLEPTMMWTHPVVIVVVPAEVGPNARTQQQWISGPVLVNGTLMDVGPMCGPNPNRVRGAALTCTEVDTLERFEGGSQFAYGVIVTGRAVDDADRTAFAHDVERTIQRWNMSRIGVRIRNEHLAIVTSSQDVVDALERFNAMDTSVNKQLFVNYIGHASTDGIVLVDGMVPWDSLASMVNRTFDGEVQIELTTSYGQRMIDAARETSLRGSIVSATGRDQRLSKGNGSGSEWGAALTEARDAFTVDVNSDNDVDQRELLQWIQKERASNDPALAGSPRVELLSEELRSEIGRTTVHREIIWDMKVFRESDFNIILRTTYLETDTLRSLYLRRTPSASLYGTAVLDVLAYRGDAQNTRREVLMSFTPTLTRADDVLLGTITGPCHGITVRQRYGSIGPDTIVNLRTATAVRDVNSYLRFLFPFTADDVEQTCQIAQSPYNNYTDFGPREFVVQPGDTTFVASWGRPFGKNRSIPDLALSYWRNEAHYDVLRPRMLLPETLGNVDTIPALSHREYTITTGTPLLDSLQASDVILTNGSSLRTDGRSFSIHSGAITSSAPSASTWSVVADTIGGRKSMSEITVNGLAAVDMTWRTGEAKNIFIVDAPCRLSIGPGLVTLRHFTSYHTNGTAFDLSVDGIDTAQIYGFNVIESTSDHLRFRSPHVVQCTDCLIDLDKCTVDSGGRVELWQSVSVTAVTPTGVPIEDAVVTIIDATGAVLATDTTRFMGLCVPIRVPLGYRDEGGVVFNGPLTVHLRNLDGSVQQRTINHTGWAQVVFEDSTISSVHEPPAPYIFAPNPVCIGEDVRITSDEAIVRVEMFAIDGTHVVSIGPNAVQAFVNTSALTPGTYVCLVKTSSGTHVQKILVLP